MFVDDGIASINFNPWSFLDSLWHKQMGEEGEGHGDAGAEALAELGTERLHLERSEGMASGGRCENVSQKPLELAIGECPEPSSEEVRSPAGNVGPESIQSGSHDCSKNEEQQRAAQISSRDQKKVPRHRRFWESSDCSCSKEVPYLTAENRGGKIMIFLSRSLRRAIGKMVKSQEKEVQGNLK